MATSAPKDIKRNGLYNFSKDGKPVVLVSVTSITGDTFPKHNLIYWAAGLAARAALQDPSITEEQAKSSITIAKQEGAKRGTLVHSFVEAVDNGAEVKIEGLPPHIRPYALAHATFVKDFSPKLLFNEQITANFTFGYAGKIDRIYEIGGKTVIVDYKTSAGYYPDMGLQLTAYKNMEFMYQGGQFVPMPKIDQTMVVLLGEDGMYTVKPTNEPLEIFLALKKVWMWMNQEKLEKVKVKT